MEEPSTCRQLVFVYGTLLRGEANHGWLAAAEFGGEAWMDGLDLHNLGPFPMAVEGSGRCHGEVVAVSAEELAKLDRLEGVPRLYRRQRRQLGDGRWVWVYVGNARQVRHAPRLEHGRWRQRQPVAKTPLRLTPPPAE